MARSGRRSDLMAGASFVMVGATYGLTAFFELPIGRAFNMGPGYFPVILSGLLAALGVAIALRGLSLREEAPFGVVAYRALLFIPIAIGIFAFFLHELGLLLGLFVLSFISCFASSEIRIRRTVATSAAIALFSTAIFGYGLKLPIPVLGSWFRLGM